MLFAAKTVLYIYVPMLAALWLCHTCLSPDARREYVPRLGAIALVLTAAGFLLPSLPLPLLLLHVIMFLVVPLTARRGASGDVAAIYLFSMMMLPEMGAVLQLSGTRLWMYDIDQTLGLGALLMTLRYRGSSRPGVMMHIPFLCIFGTAVLATARDTSFTNLLRELLQTALTYGLPYLVIIRSVRSQEDIRRIMLALMIGGAVVSAVMILEALISWPFYRQLYAEYGLPVFQQIHMRAGSLRAAGPFTEPIAGALVLVFCFLAALLIGDRCKSRWHHLLLIGLITFGLLQPQSRSAWIGALLGLLLIDLYRKRYTVFGRKVGLLAAAALLMTPVALTSDRIAARLGITHDAVESADYRQALWDRGLEEIARHPWTGQSRAQLEISLDDLRQGENIIDFVNTYLYWALVLGIPGMLVFVIGLVSSTILAWLRRSRTTSPAAAFVVAGLAAQIVMIAFVFFSGRAAIMVVALMAMSAVFPRRSGVPVAQPRVAGVRDAMLAGNTGVAMERPIPLPWRNTIA